MPSWLLIDAAKRYQTLGASQAERASTIARKENVTALYATGWCIALVALWLLLPSDDFVAKAFGVIAAFRLAEIANTVLGFVLDRHEPLLGGSLLTVALQATQIALIFAIVDHAFARNDFVKHEGAGHVAGTALDYLYLSLSSMITLGNDYSPETDLARWLDVGAGAAGIVLLGVVVARALGLPGDREKSA